MPTGTLPYVAAKACSVRPRNRGKKSLAFLAGNRVLAFPIAMAAAGFFRAASVAKIPEPSSVVLVPIGFKGLIVWRWPKRGGRAPCLAALSLRRFPGWQKLLLSSPQKIRIYKITLPTVVATPVVAMRDPVRVGNGPQGDRRT